MQRKEVINRVTEVAFKTGELISKQPLLEILGEHRVLVENHNGIGNYSSGSVDVKTRFGLFSIAGSNLEICRMTAEQIVVIGDIETITLFKGIGR